MGEVLPASLIKLKDSDAFIHCLSCFDGHQHESSWQPVETIVERCPALKTLRVFAIASSPHLCNCDAPLHPGGALHFECQA